MKHRKFLSFLLLLITAGAVTGEIYALDIPCASILFQWGDTLGWTCVVISFLFALILLFSHRAKPERSRKWQTFISLKRGYISLILFIGLAGVLSLNHCVVGKKALFVTNDKSIWFPALDKKEYTEQDLNASDANTPVDYRALEQDLRYTVIMPPVAYQATEDSSPPLEVNKKMLYHPLPPLTGDHLLGTTTQGADITAYLFSSLQNLLIMVVIYLPLVFIPGVLWGILMGYWGGGFDIITQRLIEIFAQLPMLFLIMVISEHVPPEFRGMMLVLGLLAFFGWTGISYPIRTCVMREKTKDHVLAARCMGISLPRLLRVHILPQMTHIIVSLTPFVAAALILSLTALDYIGFGLPSKYATLGRLLNDGLSNLSAPWIVTSAFSVLAVVLLLITFMGEAIRETLDSKRFIQFK